MPEAGGVTKNDPVDPSGRYHHRHFPSWQPHGPGSGRGSPGLPPPPDRRRPRASAIRPEGHGGHVVPVPRRPSRAQEAGRRLASARSAGHTAPTGGEAVPRPRLGGQVSSRSTQTGSPPSGSWPRPGWGTGGRRLLGPPGDLGPVPGLLSPAGRGRAADAGPLPQSVRPPFRRVTI